MKVLNTITYTIPSPQGHWESRTSLIRPYRLTYRGAERILRAMRRADPLDGIPESASVVRLESAIYL